MNKLIRKLLSPLPGLVKWYLSKKRVINHQGLSFEVMPGVFHPGIFFSTSMLLDFIEKQTLKNSTVLEIGAGTGILSLQAAKRGARVTATDISPAAIENIQRNTQLNRISLEIIHSDLFDKIPRMNFDWIFINPPYYPKSPLKESDFAWYCGEHHEYFEKFFSGLLPYISPATQTVMVLSDVCDRSAITRIAAKYKFELLIISEKRVWADGKNYLFQIRPIA